MTSGLFGVEMSQFDITFSYLVVVGVAWIVTNFTSQFFNTLRSRDQIISGGVTKLKEASYCIGDDSEDGSEDDSEIPVTYLDDVALQLLPIFLQYRRETVDYGSAGDVIPLAVNDAFHAAKLFIDEGHNQADESGESDDSLSA